MSSQIDFGYPWYLSYGHLLIATVALSLVVLGHLRKWSKTPMILIGVLLLWSASAFFIARFGLNVNGRLGMPTERFLVTGKGRVLDMGAGTGRSSLMVLEARPQTTVVALDLFGESYEHHFGPGPSGEERLLANLRAAGLEGRAAIRAGDMSKLPFEGATFDGVVSTYAIDHLRSSGITASLNEALRVLKPGGEFLMMVIHNDLWLKFAFGPLLLHSATQSADWWASRLRDGGFEIVERGTRPGTLYLLARKP